MQLQSENICKATCKKKSKVLLNNSSQLTSLYYGFPIEESEIFAAGVAPRKEIHSTVFRAYWGKTISIAVALLVTRYRRHSHTVIIEHSLTTVIIEF